MALITRSHILWPMVRTGIFRLLYIAAGWLSIGLATIGIVIPVLPTVPLVLLAGFFFSRSSERFDRWLVEHRWFGPIIRDWRAGLGFTVRAKAVAVLAIVVSFGLTIVLAVRHPIARLGLIALGLATSSYILTRPTKRSVSEMD